jgi:hypothetical protein
VSTITQALSAGVLARLPCNGYFFQLLTASANVNLRFVSAGKQPQTENHDDIGAGFWFKSPELLTFVEFTSDIDQTINYVYSLGQTGYDRSQTTTKLLQGSSITDIAPATVNTTIGLVRAANSERNKIVFAADDANGAGLIYLGGSSVTTANSARILRAGDVYEEDKSAVAAWYAIGSTNGLILRISEA